MIKTLESLEILENIYCIKVILNLKKIIFWQRYDNVFPMHQQLK